MSLNNICSIGNMSVSEKLEANLITWFDWGFLDKGGYINVEIDQTGCYVANQSLLTQVTDIRNSGVYWQGPENMVYESDISASPAPFVPPLIYINGILDVSGVVNYRDGRIEPSTASSGDSIKAKFSYKWVNFTSARSSPNARRIKYRHTRTDINNGDISLPNEGQIQLPSVIFDVPPISSSKPYGLDRWGARVYYHDIDVYVVGESANDVTRICDYICAQQGFAFDGFDPQLVVSSGDFPLNFDGTINSGKNHQQLSEDHPWVTINIEEARGIWSAYIHEHIYEANIRLRTKLVACFGC